MAVTRTRLVLSGLQAMFVGLGAGLHLGYWLTRDAAADSVAPTTALLAGWICYVIAFGFMATNLLIHQSTGRRQSEPDAPAHASPPQ